MEFPGRRVLAVGTANGFVCFEMGRRGAEVVGFDLADDLTYDATPHSAHYLLPEVYRPGPAKIRNRWWLAHAALNSKASVACGHANRIPAGLGRFDVGVRANVMQPLANECFRPMSRFLFAGLAPCCRTSCSNTRRGWRVRKATVPPPPCRGCRTTNA